MNSPAVRDSGLIAHAKGIASDVATDILAVLDVPEAVLRPIKEIDIFIDADSDPLYYRVGRKGVTRIEQFMLPGPQGELPYIRVWKGDLVDAEFCRHNIVGVYYEARM